MSVSKRSDLLPIDDDHADPNPYQIFGLREGETDLRVIGKRIKQIIVKLKSVQSDVEPALWKEVAKLVQRSRTTLADPAKKAALDSELARAVHPAKADPPIEPTPTKAAKSTTDPLASLLPPVNPLTNVASQPPISDHPEVSVMPPVAVTDVTPIPSGLFAGPAVNEEGSPIIRGEVATSPVTPPGDQTDSFAAVMSSQTTPSNTTKSGAVSVPQLRNTPPHKIHRRRKSIWGPLWMGTIMIAMLLIASGLAYFLFFGSGTLAITSADGKLTISTQKPPEAAKPIVASPAGADELSSSEKKRPTFDPVMGTLSDIEPPPSDRDSILFNPDREQEASMVDSQRTRPVNPQPPTTPVAKKVTPDEIAAMEELMASLRQAVRDQRWSDIKAMSEAMMVEPMSEEQKPLAEGLYQLVDLATYYREGVRRGIASLNTGDDFEVAEGFRVIIVERGENSLTVRFNAKNKSYTIDEMPLPLAHRLAAFEIPAGPLRDASKAVYQSLISTATKQHQAEAINVLESLSVKEIEGVDPAKVVISLQTLLQS